ncbi:helix-turn-helix domain-containing protein [Agarilytica rhodophyticola]|uniref:helix-turn-helix domain-containing protein n=1 Tax=Agarilytica rhodophyticola TaxID=1737490 RepID=UPI000B34589B|nr:helix-turn-helix domain-containing protein [Agarilytica rhodophyticola]
MSLIIAPLEAVTDDRLTGTERLVLLALYSFRGKDTNTVYPSLDALSERSRINDKTRISKITKSLSKKGWLSKQRRGFSNRIIYDLTVPELEDISRDENTNLAKTTNLAENDNTKLDKTTNTKLDKTTISNKQTTEQTIEHNTLVETEDSTDDDISSDELKKNKTPPCPHMKIIDAYHRILPECQSVVPNLWTGSPRAKALAARWAESPDHQSLEFWESYFSEVRDLNNGFYIGNNDRGWRANLEWLVTAKKFISMIEKIIDKANRANGY